MTEVALLCPQNASSISDLLAMQALLMCIWVFLLYYKPSKQIEEEFVSELNLDYDDEQITI